MEQSTRQVSRLLHALADPNRLRLLKCLQVRPCCVCELVCVTGMPQPRISRHLKILRDAGLLTDTRDAQWVIYAVSEPPPDSPEADLLAALRDWLEEAAETLSDRERLAKVSRAACAPLLSESRS